MYPAKQDIQPQQLSLGGISIVGAVVISLLAYIFQPAVTAYRQPQSCVDVEYYTRMKPRGSTSNAHMPTPLPNLDQGPEVLLSLVIPSYNEQDRLPKMIDATVDFLNNWKTRRRDLSYELLVVDDGSTDDTSSVAFKYADKIGNGIVRILRLKQNRGKGGALRQGMLRARGQYALMVDADGATDIACLERLFNRTQEVEVDMTEGRMAIGIGSRAHMEKESVAKRAWYRTILMKGLHVLVSVLISHKIKDTQCGFKLFTRSAAKVLFGSLHLERWGFDLEIVHLCDQLGIPMVEAPVNWHEVEGSKLIQRKIDVVLASLDIFRDMLCVRLCYLLGLWRTPYSRKSLMIKMRRNKNE